MLVIISSVRRPPRARSLFHTSRAKGSTLTCWRSHWLENYSRDIVPFAEYIRIYQMTRCRVNYMGSPWLYPYRSGEGMGYLFFYTWVTDRIWKLLIDYFRSHSGNSLWLTVEFCNLYSISVICCNDPMGSYSTRWLNYTVASSFSSKDETLDHLISLPIWFAYPYVLSIIYMYMHTDVHSFAILQLCTFIRPWCCNVTAAPLLSSGII